MLKRHKTGPFDVPLSRLARRGLATVRRDQPIAALHRLFAEPPNDYVAVVNGGGRALGVISRVEFFLWPPPPLGPALTELMSTSILPVSGRLSVGAASSLMVRRKLEGLLVPRGRGWACVLAADIVRWVAEQARQKA